MPKLTTLTAPNYYAQVLDPGQGYDGHQPNQYYQPPHNHPSAQHPSYGPVTYYTSAPPSQATLSEYESRKRRFDALDNFFSEVKRRHLDPSNYHDISQRLFELQSLQLPIITQQQVAAIPAYQPVSALAGGVGGYGDGQVDPMQAYRLPAMGNAKTRGDLTLIDQFLEQMQATIYESDSQVAQAGVTQPGTQYVPYRASPASSMGAQLQNAAAHHANNIMGQHQPHSNLASVADSIKSNTAGLTAQSSAQTYDSGHSPVSHQAVTSVQAPTSAAMYPAIPASSSMGYSQAGAPKATTLAGIYDEEEYRRRYHGGVLQHAAAARRNNASNDGLPASSEASTTPSVTTQHAKGKKRKASPKDSVIDPALAGENMKADPGERSGEVSKEDAERDSIWVQNMRLIEWMRDFVKKRLEQGEFEDESGLPMIQGDEASEGTRQDTEMGNNEGLKKEDTLYPILKAVEGEV